MYGYEPPEEFDTDEYDDEFGVDDVEAEDSEEDYDG
jgi:hypothetical protein